MQMQTEASSTCPFKWWATCVFYSFTLRFLQKIYYLRGNIIQSIFRVQMSGYVVQTYSPIRRIAGEYHDLHVCVKAA